LLTGKKHNSSNAEAVPKRGGRQRGAWPPSEALAPTPPRQKILDLLCRQYDMIDCSGIARNVYWRALVGSLGAKPVGRK